MTRYMLVGDDSGHEYAIPVSREGDWYGWMDSEEAELGVEPSYAIRLDGTFTFTDPVCE